MNLKVTECLRLWLLNFGRLLLAFQAKGFGVAGVNGSALRVLKWATRTNTTRIFRPKSVGQKMGLNRFATSLNRGR
jgi:hypothetical protein